MSRLKHSVFLLFIVLLAPTCCQGETDRVVDSLTREVQLAETPKEKAKYLNHLGAVYGYRAEYEKSMKAFIASARILELLGDTTIIHHRYINIGMSMGIYGDYQGAISYLHKSIPLCEAMHDTMTLATIYQNLATTYEYIEELDSARFYTHESLKICRYYGDSLRMARSFNTLGLIAENQHQPDSMIHYLGLALTYTLPYTQREYGDNARMHIDQTLESIYHNLGKYYTQNNQPDSAIYFLNNVLNFDSEFASIDTKKHAHKHLGDLHYAQQNYKTAANHYLAELVIEDSLFDDEKNETIFELEAKFDAEKTELENLVLKQKNEISQQNLTLKDEKIKLSWFLVGSIGFISIALIVIVMLLLKRNRTIKELNHTLKEKNEALWEAKQKHELKALLNQINPHFVFNALNSIQQFIIQNDTKASFEYFNHFGSLIRSSLEHSSLKFVAISEEIDVIKNYVSLENLRFEDHISLKIDTSNIDIYNAKIPPMFIQPLVENAIIHGLSEKTGLKEIKIDFEESDEAISCAITDNGVGRKVTSKKQAPERNSGLIITKRRLESFWMKNKSFAEILIDDLVDEKLKPAGTQVIMKLPKSF